MITNVARHTFRLSYLLIGILLIILAVFTVSARIGLPLIAGYKHDIELRISNYLGSPVDIGELALRWRGAGPMLHASDVALRESGDRSVRLDELLIDINLFKSLVVGMPVINELSLIGASLSIETDDSGQIRLYGMESIDPGTDPEQPIDSSNRSPGVDVFAWLFNASKVGLLDTQITVIDLDTGQRLLIDDLNIRAEHQGRQHQLRVDAQLPDSIGGRLEAGFDLVGETHSLGDSSGSFHLVVDAFRVGGLTRLLSLAGFPANESLVPPGVDSTGQVELWGSWQDGELMSARGPLLLGPVTDQASGDILLDSVSAQIVLQQSDSDSVVAINDINASLDNQRFQLDELRLELQSPATGSTVDAEAEITQDTTLSALPNAGPLWNLAVRDDQLPLELVTRIAAIATAGSRPALADDLRNVIANGTLSELKIDASVQSQRPMIAVSARLNSVSLSNSRLLPAFGPVDGSLAIDDSVGQIVISAEQMPLVWPRISDEQIEIDTVQATVDIDLRHLENILVGAELHLTDNGFDSSTRMKASFTADESPHVDIQSQFAASDITQIKPWVPTKLLPEATTRWINRAFQGGEATDGSFLLFGHLADFPFDDGEGVFQAEVSVVNGELSFDPSWPTASQIIADISLDGLTVSGVSKSGTLGSFNVSDSRFAIENILRPTFELAATADGKFSDLENFAVNGPLRSILEPVVGDISGTGNTQMDFAFVLPLFKKPDNYDANDSSSTWKPFDVTGSVFLDNNDVTFGRADLILQSVSGAVNFDHHGILINNLQGRLLGHPVRLSGQTDGQGASAVTTIKLTGALEANDLLAHYANPLDQFIRGASIWQATLTAPHSLERISKEGVGLTVSSDLSGSQFLLPAPYSKGSSIARRFSLETAFREKEPEQHWDVHYGDELRVRARLIDKSLHSLLIEMGEIDWSSEAELNLPAGIHVQGSVPELAADHWILTIARYIDSLPSTGDAADQQPVIPISLELNTERMLIGPNSFGAASISGDTDETYLNFHVANQAVSGSLQYPRDFWQKLTPLKARVESLDWSIIDALSADADENTTLATNDGALDPRTLPPIEAQVASLTYKHLDVSDLVLRAEPNVSGLDITTIGFAYETMRMVGRGHWYLQDPQEVAPQLAGKHTSQLNLVLQSDDFGAGFDKIGLNGIIADTQGVVDAQLRWPGPLYAPEIARLDGEINVELQSGSIVPFEPGASRIVGLFALQALPRRLNLDFKDVTHDGLAFKTISGTATIDDGIAELPLLQLAGPIGVIDIAGQSDLNTRTFDQQVTVLPRVSATLPVLGLIAGGASGGVGALIATGVLQALGLDFDKLGLRSYTLTGPWSEPELAPAPADFNRWR